jgi:hypothetical protein
MIRTLVLSLVLGTFAFGATAFASEPAPAPKKEEKCDQSGKSCKDGADCKPENCKKPETK